MSRIGLVESVRFPDMRLNRADIFIIEQPLIQSLQSELTSPVTGRAILARIGV